jgi:uncharacterized protein YndB with AHSA1/START domain
METHAIDDRPALVLTRHYPVAPEKVWAAWTDPQALIHWFGPGDAGSVTVAEVDLRVGGRYRIVFGAPDGSEHEAFGRYREVVPNRRLVFSWNRRGMADAESQVSIDLRPDAGGTALTFRHAQFQTLAVRDDHEVGWLPTFEKLAAFLQLNR